jgi:hypothetical protein
MTLPWDRYGAPPTDEESAEEPTDEVMPPEDPPMQEWMEQQPWPEPEPVGVPPPAPVAPPPSPPPPPVPPPPVDVSGITEAIKTALADAVRMGADYVYQTGQAVAAGQQVDHRNPTVTATDSTGYELVKADARSRSGRTLVQGLIIDLFFAVVALLGTVTHAEVLDKASWTIFFVLLGKTLIQTSLAYFMRLKVTPTMKTEGEKLAIMPVPRPMMEEQRKEYP